MKDVKAVVNAYPCDDNMAKNPNNPLFELGMKITIGKESQTELKLILVQIPVTLDEKNWREIFQMYASANMAICDKEMNKL